MTRVFFTAAHGGFAREHAPLGGGAAVYEHLLDEWQRTSPFELHPITPAILGENAPRGSDLTRYDEARYAEFSYAFERAATQEILRHDPASSVVLANDISEGPDFWKLAARGYRIFTIFHVDVVDYVARLYFKGWVRPETTVRWYPRLRWLMPPSQRRMAALVWEKQRAVIEGSRGLILPSEQMRQVVERCYPSCPPTKIHVLPWGNWNPVEPASTNEESERVAALRTELGIPADARIILTLSRISPEKGQDRLLQSFIEWEQGGGVSSTPLWIIICGEAAYMQGQQYLARLRDLASRLKTVRVIFPGHVIGERKRAFLNLAHIYAFPSRHESYGLTLLEAMAAGLPAVCCDTHGARSVLRGGDGRDREFGMIVAPEQLAPTLLRILGDKPALLKMSAAARRYAASDSFARRAQQLAEILLG